MVSSPPIQITLQEEYDYAQLVLVIVTTLLAIISIIYTSKTFKMQSNYNHKSVCPIIDIIISNYKNKIEISLANNGLGPAFITSFICNESGHEKEYPNIMNLIKTRLPKEDIHIFNENDYTSNINNRALKAGDRLNIFSICERQVTIPNKNYDSFQKDIEYILDKVELTVTYCDLYNNKQTISKSVSFDD